MGVTTNIPEIRTVLDSRQAIHTDVAFTGSGSEYFRIWIVNILLTLVTFGLYTP